MEDWRTRFERYPSALDKRSYVWISVDPVPGELPFDLAKVTAAWKCGDGNLDEEWERPVHIHYLYRNTLDDYNTSYYFAVEKGKNRNRRYKPVGITTVERQFIAADSLEVNGSPVKLTRDACCRISALWPAFSYTQGKLVYKGDSSH
jgi:hypothetical protein